MKKNPKNKKSAVSRKQFPHCIVKRGGVCQQYDERKVYGSAYFACRNAHLSGQESENIATAVSKAITLRAKKKKEISSDEIFTCVIEELKKHNEDASFLYETHRDIS